MNTEIYTPTNNEYRVLKYLSTFCTKNHAPSGEKFATVLAMSPLIRLNEDQAQTAINSLLDKKLIKDYFWYTITDSGQAVFDEEHHKRIISFYKFLISLIWPLVTAYISYRFAKG